MESQKLFLFSFSKPSQAADEFSSRLFLLKLGKVFFWETKGTGMVRASHCPMSTPENLNGWVLRNFYFYFPFLVECSVIWTQVLSKMKIILKKHILQFTPYITWTLNKHLNVVNLILTLKHNLNEWGDGNRFSAVKIKQPVKWESKPNTRLFEHVRVLLRDRRQIFQVINMKITTHRNNDLDFRCEEALPHLPETCSTSISVSFSKSEKISEWFHLLSLKDNKKKRKEVTEDREDELIELDESYKHVTNIAIEFSQVISFKHSQK